MKKIAYKKPLQLNKETVRALASSDLLEVAGGARAMTRSVCFTECNGTTGNVCQF